MLKRLICLGAPLTALMSCSSDDASAPEMLGEARIAIVQVPTDVRCAELVVQGNRTVQKRFDLTPGQPSTLSMNQLPVGQVAFSASTYDAACAAVTASSVPTWLSEPATASLSSAAVTDVTLVLKRNGRANVNLDFNDGPSCGAVGVSCAANTDCCSAKCTAGACVASGSTANCTAASGALAARTTPIFTVTQPVALKSAPGDTTNVYVLERTGRIRVGAPSAAAPATFLDLTSLVASGGTEQGLLGLAFHPSYATNGRFFVLYTGLTNQVVVAEYRRSAGSPLIADPVATAVVLNIAKPQTNHNGGGLEFGPDGYLYIGVGDGGGAGDPMGNSQNLTTLLGKVLRINVATTPYTSPAGNLTGGRPELWDSGLRNPYRFTFDACTGDLYLADPGQAAMEEINVEPAATGRRNYGWAIMEGNQCFQGTACNQAGLTLPTYTYPAGVAGNCAVIGGYVYRGTAIPGLRGRYVYGDYCSGRIWSVAPGGTPAQLLLVGQQLTSFGQDSNYELYITTQAGGVFRLAP